MEDINDKTSALEPMKIGEHSDSQGPTKNRRELWINLFLVVGVFFGAASSGMAIGYSAVLLPQLKSNSSTIPIDDHMGSWLASIIMASMPIGSVLSGLVIDKIGRVMTFKLQIGVVISAWLIIIFGQNYEVLLFGRFVAGVASGLGFVVGQVYFTEVCKPNMRGVISAAPFISYSLGILIVYALGAVLSWRIAGGFAIIPAAVTFVLFFIFKESHLWLVKQDRIEDAVKALTWFRGNNNEEAQKEIEDVICRFQQQKVEERFNYKLFFEPQIWKPFCITVVLNALQTLSGIYVVVFYATDIISSLDIEDFAISDMSAAVITALVRMLFSAVFCFILVKVTRRCFALLSGIITTVFTLVLGVCLYYKINNVFIPVCLAVYVAATVGLLLLPGLMLGELFPIKARGVTGGLSYTLYSLSIFGVTKAYPFFKETLGMDGMFLLFGMSSLLLTVLAYLVLPETKNRTLLEIEDYFLEKNILWITRKNKHSITKQNAETCDKLSSC